MQLPLEQTSPVEQSVSPTHSWQTCVVGLQCGVPPLQSVDALQLFSQLPVFGLQTSPAAQAAAQLVPASAPAPPVPPPPPLPAASPELLSAPLHASSKAAEAEAPNKSLPSMPFPPRGDFRAERAPGARTVPGA